QEAERLYGVAGAVDDELAPLGKPRTGFANEPLPLQPINNRLISANRRRGLKPFRLPLAIDPHRCQRCASCAGFVCPTGARSSAAQLLPPSSPSSSLHVLTGVEADQFTRNGGGNVDGVRVRERATGKEHVLRARRYVLAAGALTSPVLLLRSGIEHPL